MKPTVILIDAGYLSFISRHLGDGKSIKYKLEEFAKNICQDLNLECKKIFFYTAPPFQSPKPTSEENKRKANYDKFIRKLKSIKPEIIVREGRLQKIGKTFSQKGVDTLITMDLLRSSIESEVKELVLISADTDFVPILEDIRKKEKIKINLAYYTDKKRKSAFSLSNHLWKAVDRKLLIRKDHFGAN